MNRKLPQKVENPERRTLWALKRLSYQKYFKNYKRDHFGKLKLFRKQSHTNNTEIPFELYVCQNVNGYFNSFQNVNHDVKDYFNNLNLCRIFNITSAGSEKKHEMSL